MKITNTNYVGSFPKESDCPKGDLPEIAFIGRSNVGKSSLINSLLDRKNLAHVSGKPGKTQMINFFLVNENWYLVDLPGYGYAKSSKKHRGSLKKMLSTYLLHRENLQCAVLLLDINIPSQKIDIEFMNWMGENGIPFVIAFTKGDKLKERKISIHQDLIESEILNYWTELPDRFVTSSVTGLGRDEILNFIDDVNQNFYGRKL